MHHGGRSARETAAGHDDLHPRSDHRAQPRRAAAADHARRLQPRICWCTDDRQPADLLDQGGIDYVIRRAIRQGIDPVTAIQIGTINPANYYGLHDRGAITPGRRADLVVLDNLRNVTTKMVLRGGSVVAQDGQLLPYDKPAARSARARLDERELGQDQFPRRGQGPSRQRDRRDSRSDRDRAPDRRTDHRERRSRARPRARSLEDRRDRSACAIRGAHTVGLCEGRRAAAGRDRVVHRARSPQPGRHRRGR